MIKFSHSNDCHDRNLRVARLALGFVSATGNAALVVLEGLRGPGVREEAEGLIRINLLLSWFLLT